MIGGVHTSLLLVEVGGTWYTVYLIEEFFHGIKFGKMRTTLMREASPYYMNMNWIVGSVHPS